MNKLNDTQELNLEALEHVNGGGWYSTLRDKFMEGLEAGRAAEFGHTGYVGDVNSSPTGLA